MKYIIPFILSFQCLAYEVNIYDNKPSIGYSLVEIVTDKGICQVKVKTKNIEQAYDIALVCLDKLDKR